jgi:hypothetical protein
VNHHTRELGATPPDKGLGLGVIAPEQLGHERSTPRSWCGSVFLPARGAPADGEDAVVEVRRLVDERTALCAYSTLEALVASCGPDQPWVAVDAGRLDAVQRQAGVDLVVWDVPLPVELRRQGEVAP